MAQHIEDIVVEGNTIQNIAVDISEVTAVGEEADLSGCPKTFALHQSYPNPFNAETRLGYELPTACKVALVVYNALGQKVAVLVEGHQEAGHHTIRFDGSDLATGVYLYRLEAEGFEKTKRMLLLR